MKKSIVVGILGLAGILTASAGAQLSGQTLTKEKAKDLIETTNNYKPLKWSIPLAKADVDACVARGYLRWDTVGSAGKASTTLSVTDKGKQFFGGASRLFSPLGGRGIKLGRRESAGDFCELRSAAKLDFSLSQGVLRLQRLC